VGHASRSSDLLQLQASWARVSQFASKLAEERWRVVYVASLQRSREDEAKDGWINATGLHQTRLPLLYHFRSIRP
jgi:hypothetical protein